VAFVAGKNGTDQTGVASATWTKVTFPTEVFDEGAHFSTVDGRWTPATGRYRVSAAVRFSANVVDQQQYLVAIYKNGTVFRQMSEQASGTGVLDLAVSAIVEANGTDYFEIWARGNGAGDKTISGATISTWFEGSAL
jgi:hypothetical protein